MYTIQQDTSMHYGIVIDCGSSGSRVYVYSWPTHSGNPHDLLNMNQLTDQDGHLISKKVSPGLSSYADKPSEASEYIRPLLDYAAKYIPREKHKETPLYILATAGMRLITERYTQKEIMSDLQTDITKLYDFLVAENHFEVISGKLEGVYAWIAVNYVLDKFSHVSVRLPGESSSSPLHTRRRTIGMMDMGGGSIQIAFEVTNPVTELPKSLIAEINLGCQDSDLDHTYRIYVTTFLEYGANSAHNRYEELLIKNSLSYADPYKGKNKTNAIHDPCMAREMPVVKEIHGKKYYFKGTGDFNKCRKILVPLLNSTILCHQNPCSMNGIHQPDIDHDRSKFYGFSEFWYSTEDVFGIGGTYNHDKFQTESEEFCKTSWSKLQKRYKKKLYPKADNDRFSNQCFKGAWLATVLHEGFKFPEDYKHLVTAQLINNKDVQWTLGALLYRTRYLPLRDIEKLNGQVTPSYHSVPSIFANEYLVILCIIIVFASIILYMKRLRLCPQNDLQRVPSMSYFMTGDNESEPGLKKSSYYL
ncbi:hypothetical protein LOTGIDRAFT_123541 [Lottia gigantea]|uniref:Uncharacterized protein n=1 Tax=Lottia gigantea TaxID=225164 RepID=V4BMW7_LOTGI|nr:hypothetical protein LOTGIDRAFT_123541 [Lottia gigantea]ESO90324.1 hypothetical protein LOTGIDRAFT_123541 [Lottia gigantea]